MNMYDKLLKSIDGTERLLDKTHCSQITKLPQDNLTDIYLLILHHYVKNEQYDKTGLMNGKELPYGGKYIDKKEGKGLTFKPHQLPDILQKIIYKYICLILD